MASLHTILRPTTRHCIARLSRPMATASRHVSLSGYIIPRSASNSSSNSPDAIPDSELEVGELQGASFKIEPLRRVGEDPTTMRARLTYQSRKRGTLESDLILSTFADVHLSTLTPAQLVQYDLFLDENDWDIYYWATQEPEPPATDAKQPGVHAEAPEKDQPTQQPHPRSGEWAQTVGTFKPAYRPVPARWADSEILEMVRAHVKERGMGKGGMAFMPRLR